MKKHHAGKIAAAPSIHSIIASQKLQDADKKTKATVISVASAVTPPDEEMLYNLNKLAKESPFCFYYKNKINDLL